MEKVRKAFYVEEELLGQVDALLPQADVRSRNVIAYSHGVDEQALGKLQAKCAEEVKRINGAVRFEEAYQYQQGDRF